MSQTFVRYDDEVEVLEDFTPLNQINVIDLASYIIDPAAIGVIIRITGTVSSAPLRVQEVGGPALPALSQINPNFYISWAVSLGTGTSVEIRLNQTEDRVFIVGEIHGTDAVLHEVGILFDPVEDDYDMWIDHTPTLEGSDVLGDIDAVIMQMVSDFDHEYGLREKGSTDDQHLSLLVGGATWQVVGVDDNGIYQTFTTGKPGSDNEDVKFTEIGYIKKGSDVVTILNPNDDGDPGVVPQVGSFGVLDLSGVVPPGSIMAGGRWRDSQIGPGSEVAYMRNTDSNDNVGLLINVASMQTQMVALNGDREAEYQVSVADVTLQIMWYEVPEDQVLEETVLNLGQSNPSAATLTTIYTVPASTNTVVSTITVSNRSSTRTSFRIAVSPTGAGISDEHYLYYDIAIPGHATFNTTIGIALEATDEIRVLATLGTLSFNVFGVERV